MRYELDGIYANCKVKAHEALETVGQLLKDRIIADIERYKPYPIVDTGAFRDQLDFVITDEGDSLLLTMWSSAKHSKYVLFGSQYGSKMPPLEPLVAWVERKKLNWCDQKTGKQLTPIQMAWAIRIKIHRDGIEERPVLQNAFETRKDWIRSAISNYLNS